MMTAAQAMASLERHWRERERLNRIPVEINEGLGLDGFYLRYSISRDGSCMTAVPPIRREELARLLEKVK